MIELLEVIDHMSSESFSYRLSYNQNLQVDIFAGAHWKEYRVNNLMHSLTFAIPEATSIFSSASSSAC